MSLWRGEQYPRTRGGLRGRPGPLQPAPASPSSPAPSRSRSTRSSARACAALEDGHGVLVCAPTGAGKTVVGEFAVHLALAEGRKCFYTTPIKALSQPEVRRPRRAARRRRRSACSPATPSVNGDAPIVVMTTEVLRNMLYAGSSTLDGLGYVVMDEVHYLADRFRGAVWEEVILHLPEYVRLVSLSATVSNAEEFGDWLVEVRGDTTVVVDEHRPVPLWQHMMVGNRMLDLFAGEDARRRAAGSTRSWSAPHRELDRAAGRRGRGPRTRGAAARPPRGPRFRPPSRVDVVDRLDRDGLLPAIVFVFSRVGLRRRGAASACGPGLRMNTEAEVAEIRRDRRRAHQGPRRGRPAACWATGSGARRWSAGSRAHHAGLLPAFKETVEELFVRGLVKVVFATETLALGINMPARTVVLERLVKYNGEAHVELTPGEYTQLTGRAGRRGIDVEGHAVVVWQPGVDPQAGRRARLDAHLPAALVVPARLQHGRQPRRPARRAGRRASCWSSRSRSSRPTGRWSGWPGGSSATREALAGLRRVDDLPPRRLHRVRRRCAPELGDREKALSRKNGPTSAAPRRPVAGGAAQGRRDRRAGRAPGRARGRRRPRPGPDAASRGRWCSPRTAGPGGCRRPTSRRRSRRSAGSSCPSRSTCARRGRAATSRRRCATPASRRPAAPRRAAGDGARTTTRSSRRCAGRCARTRATAATTARRTPGGPSGTAGCERETEQLEQKVAATTHSLARGVRPDPRAADRTRLPLDGDDGVTARRAAAGAAVQRVGPARRRVPAPRRVGRAGARRAGRGRVGAGVRGAPGRPGASRGCRPGRSPTRWPRRRGCGRRWRPTSAGTSWTAPAQPDAGFAWPVYRWARGESLRAGDDRGRVGRRASSPRATSCAGAAR